MIISPAEGRCHKAFPTLAIGAEGTIHVMFRAGSGHVSNDGSFRWARSSDGGRHWVEETVLAGGLRSVDGRPQWRGYQGAQLFRTSSGTFICFANWYDFGPEGRERGQSVIEAFRVIEVDGVLDWTHAEPVAVPLPQPGFSMYNVQGITEVNGTLLALSYGNVSYGPLKTMYLYSSNDDGRSWQLHELHGMKGAEAVLMPQADGFLLLSRTDEPTGSRVYRSDQGLVEWQEVGPSEVSGLTDLEFHGMAARPLDDSGFCVVGRAFTGGVQRGLGIAEYRDGRPVSMELLSPTTGNWDSDYAGCDIDASGSIVVAAYKDAARIELHRATFEQTTIAATVSPQL